MNDKLDITLRIGDVPLSLTIDRSEEEQLRRVAKEVNHAYNAYRTRFRGSSNQEILAKVTLLFARGFNSRTEQIEELDATLDTFESNLDRLLG